jgi:hypothetical protein
MTLGYASATSNAKNALLSLQNHLYRDVVLKNVYRTAGAHRECRSLLALLLHLHLIRHRTPALGEVPHVRRTVLQSLLCLPRKFVFGSSNLCNTETHVTCSPAYLTHWDCPS